MPLSIQSGPDGIVVSLTIAREALAGMTKAQALAYIREQTLEHMGWPRLVALLPLIAATRRTRIANVGQFIHEVLTRDMAGASSALSGMVTDGTITAAERTAIIGAFVE